MSPEPASPIVPDEDKTRDQLLSELEELRARVAILREAEVKSKDIAEALRDSEERLHLAQQVARTGTFEWNIQTGVNTWTPELEAMYGLTKGGFPGTYEAWEQLVYPEDRPEAVQRVKEAMEKGDFEGEWRVVWPDGTVHWLQGRGFVFKDEFGKSLKLIGVNIDITERKQAEEALLESEARRKVAEAVEAERRRLFDVLENLPAMICLLTPDYHVAFANRSYRERFGESHGRHCYEYCFGRTEPCEFCEAYNVLKTGQPHHWEVKGLDDSLIEVYNSPFTDVDGSSMILKMSVDVTERKRLEEKLAHVASFPEQNPNPIFEVDGTGAITYSNPAANRLFPDLRTMGMDHPILRGIAPDAFKKVGESELIREVQIKDTTYQQSIHYLPDWKALRIYSRDITERKQAEKSLQKSEERFRTVFENAAIGIVIADMNRNYLAVNDRFCEITGYSREELLTLGCGQIVHPDDQAADISEVQRLLGGEASSFIRELRYVQASGTTVWVRLNVSIMRGSGQDEPQIIGIVEDITERKRAEEALRESELNSRMRVVELATTVESALDGIIIYDKNGKVVRHNEIAGKYFAKYFAYTDEDKNGPLQERAARNRWLLPDGTPLKVEDLPVYRALRGETVRDFEVIVDKDSNRLWLTTSAAPLRTDGGELFGAVLSFKDITERKRAEEELANAKAQAELYLDLMGHDINNLHQVALGYLELARDMPAGEGQAMFLDKPVEVLQRSAMLIGNVRKLQKLHDGVFKTELVDVCKLLVDVQREFGGVPHKQVTLNLNGRERCMVRANELLHDVFANMVSNAIKHTGDQTNIVVDLDVVEDDGGRYCRVMVEDDGPGILDDFKAKIFNRTLKGTAKAKGMGLGLYLVKSLVDSYGGRVWVEDRIMGDHTKGALFVVMLPVVEK